MNVSGMPQVTALYDGRIGLFIGGAYRYLTPAEAREYATQIIAVADEIESSTGDSDGR